MIALPPLSMMLPASCMETVDVPRNVLLPPVALSVPPLKFANVPLVVVIDVKARMLLVPPAAMFPLPVKLPPSPKVMVLGDAVPPPEINEPNVATAELLTLSAVLAYARRVRGCCCWRSGCRR